MPHTVHANAAASLYQAPDLQTAVDFSTFELSVSQLLGFDYIFISGPSASTCFSDPAMAKDVVKGLIGMLDLIAEQTVFITHDNNGGAVNFTRHDFTWVKGQPEDLQHVLIQEQEQQEFITMIWQCSSAQTL